MRKSTSCDRPKSFVGNQQLSQTSRLVKEFGLRPILKQGFGNIGSTMHHDALCSWIFRCKPLICNARSLVWLEKFSREIKANSMSLNQRVPGSSPGAPTKQDQVLLGNSSQNGLFSWETSLIRYEVRSRTELKLLFLCSCTFMP